MRELSKDEVLAVAGGFSDDEPPTVVTVTTKRLPKDVVHFEENYWDDILENVAHQEAAEFLGGFDGGPSIECFGPLHASAGTSIIADSATSQFVADFVSMVQAAGDVVQLPMPDGTFVSISDVLANSGAVFISDGSANGDLASANGFGGVWQVTLDLDAIHAHIDLPFLGDDYSTAVYVSILHEFVHIHTG